jgi:DNA-binding GntR family transcriptional regulator
MCDTPDIAAFLEANRAFHHLIIEAAQSPRLAATLAGLVEQPIVRRTARLYGRGQLRRSLREHNELIQAFEASDAGWAEAVMTAHIRRAYHAFAEASPPAAVAQ